MNYPVMMSGTDNVALWADEDRIESAARAQLRNIAALAPVERVAVMPDVHLGKGATVGSVIAMRDAVSPAAVGVDLGCGVSAVRTSLTANDLPDDLHGLRSAIEAVIPVGFSSRSERADILTLGMDPAPLDALWSRSRDVLTDSALAQRAPLQLGTLGGGNHFIEVCLDEQDQVWLTLHSGSRNAGKVLAERHISIAKELPHNTELPDRDLAYFFANTPEMVEYLRDLQWSQDYAACSRAVMMAQFRRVITGLYPDVGYSHDINVHHNYVSRERVDGVEYIVTRKGAIRAGTDELALIPGSMGTGSYIVRGLGNPDSFYSASHGAGRRMSRNAAKRAYTVEDLARQTEGIECRKDADIVDEIPAAYKNIHSVIKDQETLVTPVAHLRTILCVKG